MKLRFLLILPWVLALLLSCRVALADDSFSMSAADYFDTDEVTDAIPQEGQEVLDDLGISGWSEESLLSLTPEQFLHTAWEAFAQAFRQPARMLAVLVGAALLTMLLEGTQDLHTAKSIQPVFGAVTVLCLAAVLSVPVLDCLRSITEVTDGAAAFLTAYIPVMTGILLTAGRTASAASYNTLMFLGCEGAALLIRSVFLPVAGILLALGVTGSVTGDSRLQGVGKMIRRAAGWALGLVLILFIGLMTLQTSVSAAADTVTAKSAKYLLGSLIPVVGSSVSDAVMAARGCIDLIRTSVGGFGILVPEVSPEKAQAAFPQRMDILYLDHSVQAQIYLVSHSLRIQQSLPDYRLHSFSQPICYLLPLFHLNFYTLFLLLFYPLFYLPPQPLLKFLQKELPLPC